MIRNVPTVTSSVTTTDAASTTAIATAALREQIEVLHDPDARRHEHQ